VRSLPRASRVVVVPEPDERATPGGQRVHDSGVGAGVDHREAGGDDGVEAGRARIPAEAAARPRWPHGRDAQLCLSDCSQPPGTELVVRVELAGGAERVVWRRKAELVAQEVAAGVLDPGAVVADRGAEVSRRREVEVSRPELIREPNALDLREGIPVRDEPQPVARVVVDVVSG